ncbi:MAG: hypothetical protein M3473_04275 [Chloroflexota bacterium]|nr:hypothetical protein [Chloroflexota bacterium]
MTRIRPIVADELLAFASVAGPEHAALQHAYLTRLLEQGAIRTEWCYLAETDAGVVGRLALWTLPKVGTPLSVILLDTHDDEVAADLLLHAMGVTRDAGGQTLDAVLDSPSQAPQWQDDPERRAH